MADIIEQDANPVSRLDTLRDTRPDLWEQTPAAFCELLEDFKTWLLRLQEERDEAVEERDDTREALDDQMQSELQARKERDALLEALKKARGKLIDASMYSMDDARRRVNDAESIMWSAIDDVEGKDD